MNNSLPFWMLALQAFAVPVIALLAAVIGYVQWRTAQQKVVLDLFDRRMATYTALHCAKSWRRSWRHQVPPHPTAALNFLRHEIALNFYLATRSLSI
jgi:hypothetical protein